MVVGGPIDGRALVLNRDLLLESEVRAVVAGVPVLGVDAFELVEETAAFVGDFAGDYRRTSQIQYIFERVTHPEG